MDVQLIDPCNQETIQSVDFLRFEPRGTDVDSLGLATIEAVENGGTNAPIPVPLVSDFQLVATGHVGSFEEPPSAIGVSPQYDLTAVDSVTIRVPFALVDNFHKTTSLAEPTECTSLSIARYGATATYLPENGRVLVVGGAELADSMLGYPRLVELYNPQTGAFETVAELRTGGARAFHTATRLQDGRVLIAGGEAHVQFKNEALRSAFIIDARDPANVQIAEGGLAMRQARTGHTATLLDDGRVLLAGGRQFNPQADARPEDHTYLSSIEIYDPVNKVFTLPQDADGNAVELPAGRWGHSATAVASTAIALAGGQNGENPVLVLDVVRIEGDQVQITTSSAAIGVGPLFHAADATSDGTLLLSGGYATIADAEAAPPVNPTRNVEMWSFNEATGEMTNLCAASLNKERGYHTASIVGRQAVFIGGRSADGSPIADAEAASLLGVAGTCFARPPTTHPMTDPRAQHAVAKISSSGELLVVGGRQQEPGDVFGRSIQSTEIFSPRRDP